MKNKLTKIKMDINLNPNVVINTADLKLCYDKERKTFYTKDFEFFKKSIELYNIAFSPKFPSLILYINETLNKYELIASRSKSGVNITYIQYPVKVSNKLRYSKYKLKFDINNDRWFVEDLDYYLKMKLEYNKRLTK
jgi:hypothetical protein